MKAVATCGFGLESITAYELKKTGALNVRASDGRVYFEGGEMTVALANVCLTTAERVLIIAGEFRAQTFDELFDGVRACSWKEFIGRNDAFPVKGYCMGSRLTSVPACQGVIKKAIVEKLKSQHGCEFLPERGEVTVRVRFSLVKDVCTMMIDTSGDGLHKRGYRPLRTLAPIKETIASGIADLARIRGSSRVSDPFCGSGTLVIEAAMRAAGIAPGAHRHFAGEDYGFLKDAFRRAKEENSEPKYPDCAFQGRGSDIDPASVEAARANAGRAGVSRYCTFSCADAMDFRADPDEIVLINPPYGERLMDHASALELMKGFSQRIRLYPPAGLYVISEDRDLERVFGPADRRRKLYNGTIQCTLYMYFRNRDKVEMHKEAGGSP
ncbi:MAG: THUMP domain-containing class I SAM-dependent RNA methyltransferase [Oscillospiraceae bacterium]|jgi:putative N6-adenine-specific DNA methylase